MTRIGPYSSAVVPATLSRIRGDDFTITFHGVRGSTPCDGSEIARYGGNTSCVSVDAPGHGPLLLDLGTGSRYFGRSWPPDQRFDGDCLLTHLHWDHVQGLPFFGPALRPGSKLRIHAPIQPEGQDLGDIFREIWRAPAFPVGIDQLPGEFEFIAHGDDEFMIGEIAVTSRIVPHIGSTLGFRLDWQGRSLVYISDHQQPGIDVYEMSSGARDLCTGADVLVHDAQYTLAEFRMKSDWGHCTFDYATWLAEECGVGSLVLYHHDPSHDDDLLDCMGAEMKRRADGAFDVVVAREGDSMVVGAPV